MISCKADVCTKSDVQPEVVEYVPAAHNVHEVAGVVAEDHSCMSQQALA